MLKYQKIAKNIEQYIKGNNWKQGNKLLKTLYPDGKEFITSEYLVYIAAYTSIDN